MDSGGTMKPVAPHTRMKEVEFVNRLSLKARYTDRSSRLALDYSLNFEPSIAAQETPVRTLSASVFPIADFHPFDTIPDSFFIRGLHIR